VARFVKTAPREQAERLIAEADGLRELASARAVRVPEVFACGVRDDDAFLEIERIVPTSPTPEVEALLGEQLAAQHRVTKPAFGWHRDNTIGLTPQPNGWMDDWVAFYRERRLRFQLELARANGFGPLLQARGERLLEALPALLSGHAPQPSLLHGDLWGGNWLAGEGGVPFIFDPAVYYGDREADLAMTHLFGGFGPEFYRAYETAWPLEPGHAARRELYNLYHVLNHANLFGSGYARQAREMIDRLLARPAADQTLSKLS
jgi:protein-ribulosamine 3-kinase